MRRRFRKSLEDKANELAAESGIYKWDTTIPSMIQREIALVTMQLEDIKFHSRHEMKTLLRQECDIGTQIKEYRQSIPWYTSAHSPEEQNLRQRLFDIEKERRKLTTQYHDKRKTLEDRLLDLVNKHEQLDI